MTLRTLLFPAVLAAIAAQAQPILPVTSDTVALMLMDRMSATISELTSCRYTADVAQDEWNNELGMLKRLQCTEALMVGPDRMHVRVKGDRNDQGYWYNGVQVAYYSFTEHNFGFMEAPDNIMDMITEVNRRYAVDFPAADLFYPTFVEDVMASCPIIRYLGKSTVNGTPCYKVAAKGRDIALQLWIADDATMLPMKFVLTTMRDGHELAYDCTFTSWELNPDLPMALFEFMPPPGARPIRIMARTSN
jgi:hypothetical protein